MDVADGQEDETAIEKDGDGFSSSLDWDMMTTQDLFEDTLDQSNGSDETSESASELWKKIKGNSQKSERRKTSKKAKMK